MKDVINYINNNAIVAALITIIINAIIQILFRKSDRRYNEKNEKKKERKQQYLNKAEFHIETRKGKTKSKVDICLFLTDFNVSIDSKKNVIFNYRKNTLKKDNYKHMRFYIKNIGNADVNQLDICVTNQRNMMLCNIDDLKYIVEHQSVNYNYCYDRKILKDDVILIDIAYLEDCKLYNTFSSELVLLFRDSFGNLYSQPFFLGKKNLYEPYMISYKDYRGYVTTDIAIECFKNPWNW